MSRPRGSIIGTRPTWTTTATSGIWTLRQAEEMKAANQWPRGPEAPTSLAGTAGDEEVALTWTAPATTHGTIADYIVEYTPAAGSPTVVATGSTAASYTLTGLTNDTEYTFRVAAVNHTRGDFSSSVAVTPSGVPTDPDFASVSLLLHMDGSGSTFADSSGTPKTITAGGSVTQSTAQSKFGGKSAALAPGDYLSAAASSDYVFGTGAFTVEFWLYVSSAGGNQCVLDFRNGSNQSHLFLRMTSATNFEFRIGDNSIHTFTATSGQWNHIAIVRSSGTIKSYVGGVEAASTSNSTNLSANGPILINGFFNATGNGITGYIDDVRVTNGVARYTAAFTPPTAAFPDA